MAGPSLGADLPFAEELTPAGGASRIGAGMLRVGLATALFGVAHSTLAGSWAKSGAQELFGPRAADGLYRPAYLLASVVLVGLLIWYARRQPGREIYRVCGGWAWLMRAGQLAALGAMGWAVLNVGIDFMAGWDNLVAWWAGAPQVPPMPDGQGPAPAGATMLATGPFAYTRHPLNWLIVPLVWLNPRMTTRLFAFNVVATVYAVVGSLHIETHLLDAYGDAYRLYQQQVPFLLGTP
jgi:hypothetical protein